MKRTLKDGIHVLAAGGDLQQVSPLQRDIRRGHEAHVAVLARCSRSSKPASRPAVGMLLEFGDELKSIACAV